MIFRPLPNGSARAVLRILLVFFACLPLVAPRNSSQAAQPTQPPSPFAGLATTIDLTMNGDSDIKQFIDFNGTLLWTMADEPQNAVPDPWKFWTTHGGVNNATKLPLDPAIKGTGPAFKRSDGTLFFFGSTVDGTYGLWRSTAAGNASLIKRNLRQSDAFRPFGGFHEFDGIVYFDASAGSHVFFWRSDGTEAGTYPTPYTNPCLANVTSEPSVYMGNGLFYCSLHYGTPGDALWRSDGTDEGTIMLSDFGAEMQGTSIDTIHFIDGLFYYTNTYDGFSLWRSDGSREGTYLLRRFVRQDGSARLSSFVPLGNQIIFLAAYGETQELWTTDGTVDGTRLLRSFTTPPFPFINQLDIARLGDRVLFAAEDERGRELWTTDGTVEGTALFKHIHPGAGSSSPMGMTVLDDLLLFSADDGTHGTELWMSDGTVEGTMLVQDLYPGSESSNPGQFIRSGQHGQFIRSGQYLYFVARHPIFGRELWSVPYRFEVRSRVFLPLIQQTAR